MAEAVLRSELKRLNIGDVSVFSAGLEPSKTAISILILRRCCPKTDCLSKILLRARWTKKC
ncbi:MAG: hypothetical protein ACLS4Z_08375 [Christensenellaceae bacterium]